MATRATTSASKKAVHGEEPPLSPTRHRFTPSPCTIIQPSGYAIPVLQIPKRAMLCRFLVLCRELVAITISIIIKPIVQTVAAMSSTVPQYIASNHCSLPQRIWEYLPHKARSRCQQDENSRLAFAFLFIALALCIVICIGSIISSDPPRRIHPDTMRLHALERAVTRQTEINYHLSRLSQNRKLQNPNCNTTDFEQWAFHWSNIQRFREQAEADFKQAVSTWYYDNQPDSVRRYHELRNELARLQSLGRNIVNAREEVQRYVGDAVVGSNEAVVNGAGWMKRKAQAVEAAQVDETDTRRRLGYGKNKAPREKAIF